MAGKKSKKRKRKRVNQGSYSGTPRSAQTDKYAKYAGAVSNKSKRNYADLRLVRPENLKEYASENARPRTGQSSARPQGQARTEGGKSRQPVGARNGTKRASVSQSARSAPPKPKQASGSKGRQAKRSPGAPNSRASVGFGHVVSSFGTWVGSVSAGAAQSIGGKKRQAEPANKKPVTSASAGKAQRSPEYIEDEYSKALNNADYYGDILGKYSLKYSDNPQELHTAVGAPSTQYKVTKLHKTRRHIKSALNGEQPQKLTPQKPQKSIAALAVKNRTAADKRKYAKVAKNGKAKGSVPMGPVHRKVHRRDRRQSLFIGAAAVTSVALVMISVIFFAFFKVKRIEVAGDTPYSDARITQLCDFSKGDNLMLIDTVSSEQQVIDTLPYIESCKIKRTIPNVVEVNVTCANVLGVAEIGNGFWSIISTSGKILENVTNVAVVSDSDAVMSVSYEPDYRTAEELAAAKELPVLSGLEFRSGKVGEYVRSSSEDSVKGFVAIIRQGEAFDMTFTKLKYTARGYEAEYDGRINIVLGDTSDESIIKKRIEIAHHIICVTGDITEHDMGEITYLKNQTFFNPSYDISEEELAKYSYDDDSLQGVLAQFAQTLLDEGVDALDEPKEGESSQSAENAAINMTNRDLSEPQET